MVLLLTPPNRHTDSQSQTFQQAGAKVAAAEAEAVFVKVGLEVLLVQAMIRTLDKRLGIADDDVQPVAQTGIGIVGLVLMDIVLQSRDITSITVTVNRTALGKRGLGELF